MASDTADESAEQPEWQTTDVGDNDSGANRLSSTDLCGEARFAASTGEKPDDEGSKHQPPDENDEDDPSTEPMAMHVNHYQFRQLMQAWCKSKVPGSHDGATGGGNQHCDGHKAMARACCIEGQGYKHVEFDESLEEIVHAGGVEPNLGKGVRGTVPGDTVGEDREHTGHACGIDNDGANGTTSKGDRNAVAADSADMGMRNSPVTIYTADHLDQPSECTELGAVEEEGMAMMTNKTKTSSLRP